MKGQRVMETRQAVNIQRKTIPLKTMTKLSMKHTVLTTQSLLWSGQFLTLVRAEKNYRNSEEKDSLLGGLLG